MRILRILRRGENTFIPLWPKEMDYHCIEKPYILFWSNIELTWHECSVMSQITNYKEKM